MIKEKKRDLYSEKISYKKKKKLMQNKSRRVLPSNITDNGEASKASPLTDTGSWESSCTAE